MRSSRINSKAKDMKKLSESTAIICGIVRDAARGLKANIPVIKAFCERCKDYKVVIFENDSKDGTKHLLNDWAKECPEHVFAMCSNTDGSRTIPRSREVKTNRFFCRQRIEKMARLRNQYLDYVEAQGWNADYLMIVDLDVAQLFLDGIVSSFESGVEWDAVTAFGYSTSPRLKRRYHDTYALTKWGEQDIPQTEAMTIHYADELGSLNPTDDWVRIYSGFGGLAIYRFVAVKGLRYFVLSNADPMVEVRSEHVGLYKAMVERGFDRFYINPAMTLKYQIVTPKIVWNAVVRKLCKIGSSFSTWLNNTGIT